MRLVGLTIFSFFIFKLLLSLNIIFGQVAILAHSIRVVLLMRVSAGVCLLGLASSVIAVVAHVFSVVLSIGMGAVEDLSSFPLAWK